MRIAPRTKQEASGPDAVRGPPIEDRWSKNIGFVSHALLLESKNPKANKQARKGRQRKIQKEKKKNGNTKLRTNTRSYGEQRGNPEDTKDQRTGTETQEMQPTRDENWQTDEQWWANTGLNTQEWSTNKTGGHRKRAGKKNKNKDRMWKVTTRHEDKTTKKWNRI